MNITQLMKQAKQMQKKMDKATAEFENLEFDFSSQNNLITGKIKGDLTISEIHVNEELLKDKSLLEDMMMITMNDTVKKISKQKEDTLNKLTNGIDVSMFM